MRIEKELSQPLSRNPKYATTLTTTHYRSTAPAHAQARFRHKQRRPFIRTI